MRGNGPCRTTGNSFRAPRPTAATGDGENNCQEGRLRHREQTEAVYKEAQSASASLCGSLGVTHCKNSCCAQQKQANADIQPEKWMGAAIQGTSESVRVSNSHYLCLALLWAPQPKFQQVEDALWPGDVPAEAGTTGRRFAHPEDLTCSRGLAQGTSGPSPAPEHPPPPERPQEGARRPGTSCSSGRYPRPRDDVTSRGPAQRLHHRHRAGGSVRRPQQL